MEPIAALRAEWARAGLDARRIIGHNPFGNRLVEDAAGAIRRIRPEKLSAIVVATGRPAFEALMEDADFAADRNMGRLAQAAGAAHGAPDKGQVFHPGACATKNTRPAPLASVLAVGGSLARQAAGPPDGARGAAGGDG